MLEKRGINVSDLQIDHIGYQADSTEDYDVKTSEVKTIGNFISEHIVGGRRVAVFTLFEPLSYDNQTINIVEVFEPRAGQQVKSNWEHIEFLVANSLEDFMSQYTEIEWDTTAKDREEFPMLILHLEEGLRAKFPRLGVLKEQERLDALKK